MTSLYSIEEFAYFFHERANLAERLASESNNPLSYLPEAYILATTAIDALTDIWWFEEHSNDTNPPSIPKSLKFSQFLKKFAKEGDVDKIAVICLAQDWKNTLCDVKQSTPLKILNSRISEKERKLPKEMRRGYIQADKDLKLEELKQEFSIISNNPNLLKMAKYYEYGAIVYRLYRCPLVHTSKQSEQTSLATDDKIKYIPNNNTGDYVIRIGLKKITDWLRSATTNYVGYCMKKDIIPGLTLKSDREHLTRSWEKVMKAKQKI